MEHPRPCGCKGQRTCLVCEKEFNIERKDFLATFKNLTAYTFCPCCSKLYPGWNVNAVLKEHPEHSNNPGISFPGIFMQTDFLSDEEADTLIDDLDALPWDASQSGRRKQNWGPKANFKKMKLAAGQFNGFPKCTKYVQDRFESCQLLKGFQTIEQCSLEYERERGASIDPHIDDCWVWGERIVTVNCLGDTVLTLTRYKGEQSKYNLFEVDKYRDTLLEPLNSENSINNNEDFVIRIPMPKNSLAVLYGPPRYEWEHCVLREDINTRRVCIAYREFTPMYLKEGVAQEKGDLIIEAAKNFW